MIIARQFIGGAKDHVKFYSPVGTIEKMRRVAATEQSEVDGRYV